MEEEERCNCSWQNSTAKAGRNKKHDVFGAHIWVWLNIRIWVVMRKVPRKVG